MRVPETHLYANLYLPNQSFHHTPQKLSALATLVDRAYKIADNVHNQEVLDLLQNIFRQHGFSPNDIQRVIHKKRGGPMKQEEEETIKGVAIIPFLWLSY